MKNITALKGASSIAQPSRKSSNHQSMKLRFKVNQAECFRRGINCDKSIVSVDVDPSSLSADIRGLIADRLDGIDLCRLVNDPRAGGLVKSCDRAKDKDGFPVGDYKPVLIEANEPTFEALVEAIKANDAAVRSK